jgi:hypothetical protein
MLKQAQDLFTGPDHAMLRILTPVPKTGCCRKSYWERSKIHGSPSIPTSLVQDAVDKIT